MAAGPEFDHDRYRLNTDEPQHDLVRVEHAALVQESLMSEPTDDQTRTVEADPPWPTPGPTLPPEQLTARELIARAAYCDEIAHTGSPAEQAAALRDLDAAWDEAERRAAGQPPASVPAQVAGYIGLVREDYDHALAAEAATWRQQLGSALPPSEPALDLAADRVPSTAAARGAGGELTVGERADRAQSLAQAAGVDVAGYDPDTAVYTDPDTGQVVRLDGLSEQTAVEDQGAVDWEASSAIAERDGFVLVDPSAPSGVRALTAAERATLVEQVRSSQPRQPARWTADEHGAYLDSRPDETSAFNPAADYGDPDWREPASDEEATARTGWLAEHTPPAPGWALPPSTEVDDALDDARERAVHSDWAHDHDPQAWAQYRRLEALAELAPLPPRDALNDPEHDNPERGNLEHDEPNARNHDGQLAARNDPQRLRQRVEDLRAAVAFREASAQGEVDGEQRREQLARWYDDDHRAADATTDAATDHFNDGASDMQQETQDGGDYAPGWTR